MEFKLDFALGIQISSPLISDLTHFHSQSLPTSQNIYPNLSQFIPGKFSPYTNILYKDQLPVVGQSVAMCCSLMS